MSPARSSLSRGASISMVWPPDRADLGTLHRAEIADAAATAPSKAPAAGRANQHVMSPHEQF